MYENQMIELTRESGRAFGLLHYYGLLPDDMQDFVWEVTDNLKYGPVEDDEDRAADPMLSAFYEGWQQDAMATLQTTT